MYLVLLQNGLSRYSILGWVLRYCWRECCLAEIIIELYAQIEFSFSA